jgi:hypothetical protein
MPKLAKKRQLKRMVKVRARTVKRQLSEEE